MKNIVKSVSLSVSLLFVGLPAHAALTILACEPEWAALAGEIGGDKIKVSSATTALQDPHRIEARPSLIARTRNADLLICTGLELEVGWLPILLQQSGNSKIQSGQAGNFQAGQYVQRLEIPTRVDRSEGDVHAGGNPHIQQDPRNIALVSVALAQRMAELDPENGAFYQERHKDFMQRWKLSMKKWELQIATLKGIPVIEHHKNMAYLLSWTGLVASNTLEPRPGVEPSAAHLSSLLNQLQKKPAKMVLRAAYQDGRASQWLSEQARIKAVMLPFTVGGSEQAKDLFSLFDDTVARLSAAAK